MKRLLCATVVMLLAGPASAQTTFEALIWEVAAQTIADDNVTHFQVRDFSLDANDAFQAVWIDVPLSQQVPNVSDEYYYSLAPDRGGLHTPDPNSPTVQTVRMCSANGCGVAATLIVPSQIDPALIRRGTITLP